MLEVLYGREEDARKRGVQRLQRRPGKLSKDQFCIGSNAEIQGLSERNSPDKVDIVVAGLVRNLL